MFLVHLQNGELWQEGDGSVPDNGIKYVKTWADIPKEILIAGVTLTDGLHIYETLKGYDQYLVCQEAVVGLPVQAGADGSVEPVGQAYNSVVGQTLYGIRDWKPIKQEILKLASEIRDQVRSAYEPELSKVGRNLYYLKGYCLQEAEITSNVNRLCSSLESKEIARISIKVEKSFLKRPEFKQDIQYLRTGQPHLSGFDVDDLKPLIYKQATDGR